jgi:hypothetical protein
MAALCAVTVPASADEWESLFDGKTLNGWDGDPNTWSVKDGTITGTTYNEEDKKLKGNTFIIWRGGEVDNFELELEYKIVNGNSGVQYRSFEVPNEKWVIGGYQADFEAGDTYSGILYGERYRGILALRGESTELVRNEGKFEKKVLAALAIRMRSRRRSKRKTGTSTASLLMVTTSSTSSTA